MLNTGTVDNINTYVYCPHPGTEYAEEYEKYGMSIIDSYDDIQESGGYPTSQTTMLTRNQIFTAYLMSQLLISEVKFARDTLGLKNKAYPPNQYELRRLFEKVKSDHVYHIQQSTEVVK